MSVVASSPKAVKAGPPLQRHSTPRKGLGTLNRMARAWAYPLPHSCALQNGGGMVAARIVVSMVAC
eukprot:17676-Alexandrium_andersonii.AAC.1